MSTQEVPLKRAFSERAKANDEPVGRPIGFEAKGIADGRATVVLAAGPQHAKPYGGVARRDSLRHCRRRDGDAICKHPHTGGIFHYGRTEDQFLSPYLAGRTQSGRNRRAAGLMRLNGFFCHLIRW
ncbi:MAG: hypothetical protein JWO80_1435 [Bryobacterales bacterium]|nr:hypothetical protein [Bryobacterales bacterium]